MVGFRVPGLQQPASFPGGDVFVHVSNLTNGGSDDMVVGAEMTFDIEEAARFLKRKWKTRKNSWKQNLPPQELA